MSATTMICTRVQETDFRDPPGQRLGDSRNDELRRRSNNNLHHHHQSSNNTDSNTNGTVINANSIRDSILSNSQNNNNRGQKKNCMWRKQQMSCWYSSSEDEGDDDDDEGAANTTATEDDDEGILPAIRRSLSELEMLEQNEMELLQSNPIYSSMMIAPSQHPVIRRVSSYEFSSSETSSYLQEQQQDGSSSSSSSRSSVVRFSKDPPQVFSYEKPSLHYYCSLYYGAHEMQDLINEYMEEQKNQQQQENTDNQEENSNEDETAQVVDTSQSSLQESSKDDSLPQAVVEELDTRQVLPADSSSSSSTHVVEEEEIENSPTSVIRFSEEPDQVFQYEKPSLDEHCLLYYSDAEVDEMIDDYYLKEWVYTPKPTPEDNHSLTSTCQDL